MTTLLQPPGRRDAPTWFSRAQDQRLGFAREVATTISFGRPELDAWIADALRMTVQHACVNSPFYRTHVPEHLAHAASQGEPGAFQSLPFTTREALLAAYPMGMLAVPRSEVIRFDESSGTSTGKPIAAAFTLEDWLVNNLTVAALLSQVVGQEAVAIAVPYELAGVGQDLDRAFEILGCTVVPLGAASPNCPPERMVHALYESQASTLVCSGTRALYLGEIAGRNGIDPNADLSINKILMAGEGSSPAKRQRLRDMWAATPYSMFGMTETNTLALFCTQEQLHLVETRSLFEVVDPGSGDRLPDGEIGELTVTTLASRAMPLLRYRTGDTCQIDDSPCKCGSPLRRLRHRGRLGDRIRIGPSGASQLEIEDIVLDNLHGSPYYFSFAVRNGELEIALPPQPARDPDVTHSIADAVLQRIGAGTRFRELDIEQFETALRTSAKPTMHTFRANDSNG